MIMWNCVRFATAVLASLILLGSCRDDNRDESANTTTARESGPLAVIESDSTLAIDVGLGPGVLNISTDCVTFGTPGETFALVWRNYQASWDDETQEIVFENGDDPAVIISNGDELILGGARFNGGEWIKEPDDSCPPRRWLVTGVRFAQGS